MSKTTTQTQFDLNAFIKGQMEKDFREVNDTEVDTVKGAIKKVITQIGRAHV